MAATLVKAGKLGNPAHGHKGHGESIKWPALYEHLRRQGHTKASAARISNGLWRKRHGKGPASARVAASIDEGDLGDVLTMILDGDTDAVRESMADPGASPTEEVDADDPTSLLARLMELRDVRRAVLAKRKQDPAFEAETVKIRENAKGPGAGPHKFTAAEWTHPNGHPRCVKCGDEQRLPEGFKGDLTKIPVEQWPIADCVGAAHKHAGHPDQAVHGGGRASVASTRLTPEQRRRYAAARAKGMTPADAMRAAVGMRFKPAARLDTSQIEDRRPRYRPAPSRRVSKRQTVIAGPVIKAADEKRYTLGPWYVPDTIDAHGEFATADDLEEAAWEYVKSGDRKLRLQHVDGTEIGEWVGLLTWPYEVSLPTTLADGSVVERSFPAGTVFMGAQWNERGWELVKKGAITGYSIGGWAKRVVVHTDAG